MKQSAAASHTSKNAKHLNDILMDAVTFSTFRLRCRNAVMLSVELGIRPTEAAALGNSFVHLYSFITQLYSQTNM